MIADLSGGTARFLGLSPRALAALLGATALAGIVVAIAVPIGLPYDEPAHWANVQFFLREHRMPVLGESGVYYEAQQTPLYYLVAAFVAGIPTPSGTGIEAVRLFGVVGHVILTWLIYLLLRLTLPANPTVQTVGTAFIGLNPMLLVMAGSVQNDTWALVMAFSALALTAREPAGRRWVSACLAGVLVGLAVLVKVTMAPVAIAVFLCFALRRRFSEAAVFAGATGSLTLWWFVRNLRLYGDLTGQSAVARTGAVFEHLSLGPFELARTILSYLTIPTEYLRNVISAPTWVDALTVALGVVLLVGLAQVLVVGRRRTESWPFMLITATGAVALLAWFAEILLAWPVAFRTAYGVLPLVALGVGSATSVTQILWVRRAIAGFVVVSVLAIGVWVVCALRTQGIDGQPLLEP